MNFLGVQISDAEIEQRFLDIEIIGPADGVEAAEDGTHGLKATELVQVFERRKFACPHAFTIHQCNHTLELNFTDTLKQNHSIVPSKIIPVIPKYFHGLARLI
jgi:hypothetical protein